jgi:acyl carrier protein
LASRVFEQPVRIADSIEDLGVDSLTLVGFCAALEDEFGVEVSIEQVLDAPDIGALARSLGEAPV